MFFASPANLLSSTVGLNITPAILSNMWMHDLKNVEKFKFVFWQSGYYNLLTERKQ